MIYTVTLNPAVDRELTVPTIEYDTVLRATRWQIDCGGKGFNVSRMLKALGSDSVALSFAGGRSGELLEEGLQRLGIATDFVWVEGETRTNISIVTSAHDRYIKVNEPGPTVLEADQAAMVERIRGLVKFGDWWVLSGSLPPGVPPTIYADFIQLIQSGGAYVILDTSGSALQLGCRSGPYLVKPNETELGTLTGLPIHDRQGQVTALEAVRSLGPHYVIVSLGKEGALFHDDEGIWYAASAAIAERNPIGAGDSMVAGLVWGLSRGESLRECVRWGLACGAATASLPGTQVGEIDTVRTLYHLISLTQISDI